MDDLISRQQALDLAKDIIVPTKDGNVYRHRCIDPDEVKNLPSAKPTQKKDSNTLGALDCVSRQAAIDGVKTLHDVAWKNWHEPTLSANAVLDMIRELPSAQPDLQPTCNQLATDCISRQTAIDAVGNMLRRKFGIGGDLAEITLAGLPSAQPEIIFCKDCKWSDWYDAVDGHRYCHCMETGASGRTADDFCSYAEREEA